MIYQQRLKHCNKTTDANEYIGLKYLINTINITFSSVNCNTEI